MFSSSSLTFQIAQRTCLLVGDTSEPTACAFGLLDGSETFLCGLTRACGQAWGRLGEPAETRRRFILRGQRGQNVVNRIRAAHFIAAWAGLTMGD